MSGTANAHAMPLGRPLWSRLLDVAGLAATPLRPSHYLALANPLWTSHALQARVEAVHDETADARTLTLRPGRGWRRHRAGQFVRIGLALDGMRHTRTYSIASSPDRRDGCIAITVKAMPGGRVSPVLVRTLRPGAYLSLSAADGTFVLPEAAPVRPLFITAGSGITPVMSMLRTFALRDESPDVVHVHYAPHTSDVIFGEELRALAAARAGYRLQTVFTREREGGRGGDRHFSAAQLQSLCPDWRGRDVWACGPRELLDAVEAHWAAAGLPHRLHVERFHAPLAALPADAVGGTVRFALSGRDATADAGMPLLRVAENAGLNPPHGCRMGICHTCDATLRTGCVRDLRTGTVCAEPNRKIQLCVSAALGDVEIEL
jgi:ferredoxin-NADP reductase